MLDFEPNAHPTKYGIQMLSGTGDVKGFTVRATHGKVTTHEAYAVYGEKVKRIGEDRDMLKAYALIENWYISQENYHRSFA